MKKVYNLNAKVSGPCSYALCEDCKAGKCSCPCHEAKESVGRLFA